VHTRVMRVPFLVAAAGVITLLAAGCSGSGNSASGASASGAKPTATATPQQALLLAAHSSQKVNSLDANISIQATTAASGSFTMSGTLDEEIHPSLLAELNVPTFSAGGQTVAGGLGEVVTPSAFYMRISELTQSLHTSKPWVEIPFSALGANGSSLQSLFSQIQSSSPVSQTQLLATSKNVRKVGTGVVDGVPVTEYAGSFSMSQAIAALPASERSTFGSDISQAGITSSKFQIWIDGQNLPRKLVVTESGTSLSETVTMNIIGYNQPVSIQLPSASQTYVLSASDLGGVVG
jgi:hypothetical protein